MSKEARAKGRGRVLSDLKKRFWTKKEETLGEQKQLHLDVWSTIKIDVHCHVGEDIDGKKQDARTILVNMQKYNIRKTVIFPFNTVQKDGFRKDNMMILDLTRKHESLIGFARIDPRHPGVLEEMEWAKKMGLKGFKLHSKAQKFNYNEIPNVFEKGTEIGLPFILHSAHKEGLYQKQLAEIIPSYPDLVMILGHAGIGDQRTVVRLAQEYKNVYLDTSINFKHNIELIVLSAGADKVLFGSDAPYGPVKKTLMEMEIDWPRDRSVVKVMYDNAARILGVE